MKIKGAVQTVDKQVKAALLKKALSLKINQIICI